VLGGFTTGLFDLDSGWASTRTILPLLSKPNRRRQIINIENILITTIISSNLLHTVLVHPILLTLYTLFSLLLGSTELSQRLSQHAKVNHS